MTLPTPKAATQPNPSRPFPDFSDTEKTFLHLSDGELAAAARLFGVMGYGWMSDALAGVGSFAVRWGLPGAAWGARNTIYRQFVGGTSLENALPRIERLHKRNVTSILDYGAEAKSEEADFNRFRDEVLRAAKFGSTTPAANTVVVKVTGLAPNDLLERLNDREIDFDRIEEPGLRHVVDRLDRICRACTECGVQLYIDAEESWFQNTIDQLADEMMGRYNAKSVVVASTYQLYRHDRLAFLKASHERARERGVLLGAKLVRGAYMTKERRRATERGYASPIQPNIEATHRDFDAAVAYCIENHDTISSTIGTHNEASTRLGAKLLDEHGIPREHPNVRFAQLLGMSDNLTFNLVEAGYNVSKYMVYGPVREVLPYLVRRAEENSSVTGEMGRELKLVKTELRRRKQG